MVSDREPLPEYKRVRVEAAREIEHLLHKNPAHLRHFRERIRAYGEQGRAWMRECEEIDQKHKEDEAAARHNSRLRDKRMGPPAPGYEWYDHDRLYESPLTRETIKTHQEQGFPGTWKEFPQAWREKRWGYWRRESRHQASHPAQSLGLESDGHDLRFRPCASIEETLERYYIILAAIHDWDLEGGIRITQGVWCLGDDDWTTDLLLKDVYVRVWSQAGDHTDLVKTALDCVKADLRKVGEKPNGQSSETAGGGRGSATGFTDTEENILEALGNEHMTGPALLRKAGYDYSSHYRQILSNLRKRGILGHDETGYFRLKT